MESSNGSIFVTIHQNEIAGNFTFNTTDDNVVENFAERCLINITGVRPNERVSIVENSVRTRRYNYTDIIIQDDDGKHVGLCNIWLQSVELKMYSNFGSKLWLFKLNIACVCFLEKNILRMKITYAIQKCFSFCMYIYNP